jgi:hypothetical protein
MWVAATSVAAIVMAIIGLIDKLSDKLDKFHALQNSTKLKCKSIRGWE